MKELQAYPPGYALVYLKLACSNTLQYPVVPEREQFDLELSFPTRVSPFLPLPAATAPSIWFLLADRAYRLQKKRKVVPGPVYMQQHVQKSTTSLRKIWRRSPCSICCGIRHGVRVIYWLCVIVGVAQSILCLCVVANIA